MKLLFALMAVVALARPVGAENQKFRIATLAPPGSPWMQLLERAASEIAKITEQRITIKYYGGGQQGDERDFIRKIKLGQLDGAAVTSVGLSQIYPGIRVLELPMLFESQEEVEYVTGKMWPYFQKKFEEKDFRLGDRGELGWIYFFSKEKVSTLEELRKQKLWVWGDDLIGTTMLSKLNVSGVPLGVPEVDSALTSGKINAVFGSPLATIALQWNTKVKYMSAKPTVFAIGSTVFSLAAQKKVSAEDVKTLEAMGKRSQKKVRAVIRRANEEAHKTILKKGITTVEPSAELVSEMKAAAAKVQTELTDKVYSKEELAMVIGYRDEFRAQQAKKAAKK